ncbi:uncharacterized protein [Eurosta solidaginis]|uniref:uncharacterized protein n=1 Tax=Eurosta solidaginis TaxID=178769 RepID=UPI00353074E8
MEINIAAATKRKKRVLNFTAEEKRALIREVKEWPRIWDTSDPLHCNKNAVDQAWVHLSSSFGKEVSESKDAWTSLRESYRYHARASKRQKSGSCGGAALDAPIFSEDIDWEFAGEMAFLPNVSQKRRTFTSSSNFSEESSESPLDPSEDLNSTQICDNDPQYDYNPKRSKPSTLSQSPDEKWGRFNRILKKQEEFLEDRKKSPYTQALSTFDWLLNELPRSVGDDMCLHINSILLQKIEEHISSQTTEQIGLYVSAPPVITYHISSS